MPRAYSAAAKRRRRRLAKAAHISLPGGEITPARADGRATGRIRETPEDAMGTALQARIRHGAPMGQERRPIAGEPMGLCILECLTEREHAEAWQTWCAMSAAHRTFRSRIIGTTGTPQNAAIAMQPDDMQTDQGHTVDLRDAEQKDTDARLAWERWHCRIRAIYPPGYRKALTDALGGARLWDDGRPTRTGQWAALALRAVAEKMR
jgi:hypothetical protein